VCPQDSSNGGGRHPVAEPGELAFDALIAPKRVLDGQADDQRLDLPGQRRSASRRGWVGPVTADHPTMPAQQRLGSHHERRPTPVREQPAQQRQPRLIDRLEPNTGLLAPKDLQLVAQHQDLDLFGLAGPKAQQHQRQRAPQRQVHQRPDHDALRRHPSRTGHRSSPGHRQSPRSTSMTDFWHPTGWRALVPRSRRRLGAAPRWDCPSTSGAVPAAPPPTNWIVLMTNPKARQ